MNRNIVIAIVAILVLLGVGGFFLMNNSATAPSPSPEAAMTAPSASPEAMNDMDADDMQTSESTGSADSEEAGVKEITVESNGLNFTPNTITVRQGDKVKLTYKNNMGRHDWNLDEFNADTGMINAGQSKTIEFTASKKGTFEYYCSVPGHREAGMKGTFIVQ